ARGAQVCLELADVASESAMREVLDRIASSLPPLRGVVNASGIIAEGTVLQEQSWKSFASVLDVKVAGSWILHSLTRDVPLDFFVGFSSASSVLRSPGQASYAAGNAFKDALAHERVRSGLRGLAVNWGPWAEVGMGALASDLRRRALRDRGM